MHDHQGPVVVRVTSQCNIRHIGIEWYPEDQGGNFPVKVKGKWYACILLNNDHILFGFTNKTLKLDGQVFKLCDNGAVPRVVRQAEAHAYLIKLEGVMYVFDPVLSQKQRLDIYPENPTPHFVLTFDGSEHAFILNGNRHFVVKVHTIPEAFEYNETTYTVSRHGSNTMVSDGIKKYMCAPKNGEHYVHLVKD